MSVTDSLNTRPAVTLAPGRHKRAEQGHPWIYSNEIVPNATAKLLTPGTLVTVLTADGRRLGVAGFNPHPLVGLRLFDRDPGRQIDRSFFESRFKRALDIRSRLFGEPFYRLIHAEADGLPGLIVDRYGAVLVCQLNTATMSLLEAEIVGALQAVLDVSCIVLRNDSPARQTEGLPSEIRVCYGARDQPLKLRENDAWFVADLSDGQKTGWFFDQRANRAFMAGLAKGARVLDAYSFTGGFGVLAAVHGAAQVTLLDRSAPALKLAQEAARLNEVEARVHIVQGEAFETLETMAAAKEKFDIVILDPPAFVKSRKDLGAGSRGYRKLARLGASVTARHGYLFAASCSHNMPLDDFQLAVRQGLADAGRSGRIIHTGFAGPDHPVHPALPESAYLKALALALE